MKKLVSTYKGYTLKKCYDHEVDGGSFYTITKDGKHITTALTKNNAKELINSDFDERYMV